MGCKPDVGSHEGYDHEVERHDHATEEAYSHEGHNHEEGDHADEIVFTHAQAEATRLRVEIITLEAFSQIIKPVIKSKARREKKPS